MGNEVNTDIIFAHIQKRRVLVVGDIMEDIFIEGKGHKLSSEAPIPVLLKRSEMHMPGGAFNVVRNLIDLGVTVFFSGVVGKKDSASNFLKNYFSKPLRKQFHFLALDNWTTPIKIRFRAGVQQVLRVDDETIRVLEEKEETILIKQTLDLLSKVDCVVLSDYAKGVLSPRLVRTIVQEAKKLHLPVLVDPKTRWENFVGATLLTPNQKELSGYLAKHVHTNDNDMVDNVKAAIKSLGLNAMIITRAEQGALYVNKYGKVISHGTTPVSVFDVSGAGDTFLATIATFYNGPFDMDTILNFANTIARVVVQKRGTATVPYAEFIQALKETKIYTQDDLQKQVHIWRQEGFTIGFANGCFDLLHPGHIRLLKFARSACDKLIVAVNADASVTTLKGKGRPIASIEDRMDVLAAVESVDAVVSFDELTPLALIQKIQPNVLVKGADYQEKDIVGYDEVTRFGGRVLRVPIFPNRSTTQLVQKTKKVHK